MKYAVLPLGALLLLGIAWLTVENRQLRQQVDSSMSYQSQLQQLSEKSALQRLQFEDEIADLNRQLTSAAQQLSSLSTTLQEARLQVDPDYAALLQQARDEVDARSRQSQPPSGGTPFATFANPANASALANASMPKLYDSYLNALGIPGTERQQVMEALIDFATLRYQMLGTLLEGSLSPDEAVSVFGADALALNMQDSLTAAQQDELRLYDQLLKQDALREVYQQALQRTGSAISGSVQNRVVAALLDEVLSFQTNWGALVAADGSMRSAHHERLAAFDRARDTLQGNLNAQQLNHLDRFIEAQGNGVDIILEASTDGDGRVSIIQARVTAENLPQ